MADCHIDAIVVVVERRGAARQKQAISGNGRSKIRSRHGDDGRRRARRKAGSHGQRQKHDDARQAACWRGRHHVSYDRYHKGTRTFPDKMRLSLKSTVAGRRPIWHEATGAAEE